jgi:pimeloyl-ACP methyl ester carboxylesterase
MSMELAIRKRGMRLRGALFLSAAGNLRGWRAGLFLAFVLAIAACGQRGAVRPESRNASEEAVRFTSGEITLSGTLVLPAGSERQSAVVLFHGSGPQGRDLFMARWFANQGIAALAYDKRGVGESGGNFRAVPFMELCNDGLAAIEYLKTRKEIEAKRIGVWGLSQGGWLGPLAASRSADVAFVIAVSGPGVSPGEQMIVYYANELRAQGVPDSEVREASAVRRDIWNYMSNGDGYEKVKKELEQSRTKPWYAQAKAQEDDSFGTLPTPAEWNKQTAHITQWFKQEAVYDPVPTLRAVQVPALFLFGDRDQLIPVAESVAAIRRVLAEDSHHDFTIREFPNDDHGMQLTAGEASGEIDPEYLKTMREWLATHIRNSL